MQTWKAVSVCLKKMVTQTHTKILGPIKSDKLNLIKKNANKQANPNSSDPNEYRVIEHTKPIVQQITTKLKAEKTISHRSQQTLLLQQRCSNNAAHTQKKKEVTVTPG